MRRFDVRHDVAKNRNRSRHPSGDPAMKKARSLSVSGLAISGLQHQVRSASSGVQVDSLGSCGVMSIVRRADGSARVSLSVNTLTS